MWSQRIMPAIILNALHSHSHSTQECEYLSTRGSAVSQTSLECADFSVRGSAMLQKSRLTSKALMATPAHAGAQSVQAFNLEPADAPLTEEGFAAVVETCCMLSFDEYSRRLLIDMEMEICDEGCYNGFIPFFDCKKSGFQEFQQAIMKKSNELCACFRPRGECPLGGLPKVCLDGNTGVYDPTAHRRRTCPSSSTTRQPQPTPAPLVSTTDAIITKPTCAEYVCQQAGWTKKSAADDLEYPSDSICCEPTCRTYKCKAAGWVKKNGMDGAIHARDEICCEETCLAYSCQTIGWVKRRSAEDQTNPNDDVCCSATCSSYTCRTAGWVMRSGVEDLINPDDDICCEATCQSYTCKTSGWVKKPGVERTVGPSHDKCCTGPTTTSEITTIVTTTATSTIARKITIATSTTWTTVISTSTTTTTTTTTTTATTTKTITTTTTQHKSLLECGALLSQVQAWCNESLACNEAEDWLLQCSVEACNTGNASEALAVAAKYDTCGDPEESCDGDLKAYAKNACYTAINEKCSTASPDFVDTCVADVCAASQAGDPSPLDIATDYCDFLMDPDENDTRANSSNGTEGNLSEQLCSGPSQVLVIQNPSSPSNPFYMDTNHSRCGVPVPKSVCEEQVMKPKKGVRYLPSEDSPRPENGTDLPHGCLYTTFYDPTGNMWVWNENPGGIQGTPFKGGSVSLYCCDGGFLHVTTTTTTTIGWVPWEPKNCDNPAPRPISPSPSPVVIDRPADAQSSWCTLYGDPHITMFDKNGANHGRRWSFYGHGHFWVVRSSSVWIQADYGTANIRRPSWSTVRRLAIGGPFLLGCTMVIDSAFAKMWWNDQNFSMPLRDSNGKLLPEDSAFTALDGAVEAFMKYGKLFIVFPKADIMVKISHLPASGVPGRLPQLIASIRMLQISGQDGHCGNFNDEHVTKAVDKGQDLLDNCD